MVMSDNDKTLVVTRIFDDNNPNYFKSRKRNEAWLDNRIFYYNELLHHKGYLFLSDVLLDLGFGETYESRTAGWVLNKDCNKIQMDVYFESEIRIVFKCLADIRDYLLKEATITSHF